MGIWKMSQLKAPPLTDDPVELRKYINYLSNQIAIMFKDLDFTLNGDINFTNVKADGITAKNIKAGSVTAEKIHVDELSAISADLGKITAGEVYGTYISTNETGYPKTEMSNTEKLFRTSYDENNYINYVSNYANAPAIEFVTGTLLRARISTIFADWEVYAPMVSH